MSISFNDKVAIVTGAGGGLGRCHALELARLGAKVVVNDLGGTMDGSGGSSEAAESVVAEIKTIGGEAIANGGSVSDRAGAQSMVDDAMNAWGRVDVLINNAGILRDKSFSKMTLDDFEMVVNVHLLGAAYCSHAVWPIMREQNYGRILMTTSPSGLYGNFGQTNYGAAKMGQVGLMNSMKIEGAKNNIHTNSIAPVAATRMTENLMPEEVLEKLGPELVTPAAIFLVSEDAPNGVILQAQGGQYSLAAVVENSGVNLGVEATADDVA
ncbi:MAG: SDR family NAD(P)-dependent oxidoreductase, partial [Pseudomonadota bacterium]|nr:SDR family NAD(P)-dependent oxidoreductase [Pseudomonadota bacterium]